MQKKNASTVVRRAATATVPSRRPATATSTVRYQRVSPRPLSMALYSAFAGGVASVVLPATLAWANPQGQQVVQGSASFQAQGNTLTVTNTPGAAINWQSFSIKANETTHFQQANSASSVLNRVVNNNPSELLGNLTSNGKVVLINPFGITVGRGAVVDTAGFTASTLNITDADWANGKLRFTGNALSGDVKVDGVIRSANGDVMLFAPNVSVGADGIVKAGNGNVIIGAGQKVEVTGRGLEGIRFEIQSADNKAVNLGRIEGNAVGIFAGTLRHSGAITAQTATMEGGRVVLRAVKDVEISAGAKVNADGAAGKAGGQISISSATGDVLVGMGAKISANGGAGAAGGSVGITAEQGKLTVEQNALVSANGSPAGSIRLFAATDTRVAGVLTAVSPVRADSTTQIEPISIATGGKVEVLGKQVSLETGAQVDVSGDGGGGVILIGGDYQGTNAAVPNAQNTSVAPGVTLTADGRVQGDGGKVIVWADNDTHFSGTISAKGGILGGNGGNAETSGKHVLIYRGRTNLSAARGNAGTLLLDPDSIIIQSGTFDGTDTDTTSTTLNNGTGLGAVNTGIGAFTIFESEIANTDANILLVANNKISTSGAFITLGGAITLLANRNLTMLVTNATNTGDGIDLTSGFNGATLKFITQGIGTITLMTAGSSVNGGITLSSLVTAGGAVTISSIGKIANAGGVTVNGTGAVAMTSALTSSTALAAGTITTVGGSVSLNANTGGSVFISGPISTSGGVVSATGEEVLILSGTTGNINAGNGNISLTASGTTGRVQVDSSISITGRNITVQANRVWIDSTSGSITGTTSVMLAPYTAGRQMIIGGDDTNSTGIFGLSAGEIARITTNSLQIGNSAFNTGNIDITQAVTTTGTLFLATGGNISQGVLLPVTASGLRVDAADVFMQSENLVTTFAGKTTSGQLFYRSNGSFNVGTVAGLSGVSVAGGDVTLQTNTLGSTITLFSDVKSAGGAIGFYSDHLRIGGNIRVDSNTSTLGSAGAIYLGADLSADLIGRKLVVDASAVQAGMNGGNVDVPTVTNFGGAYLNLLDINAQSGAGGTNGTVSLSGGTIALAANGTAQANQATLAIGNAFVLLPTSSTIDTNISGATLASYGGLIDLSTATLGSDSGRRTLALQASNGTGGSGGSIKLGTASTFGTLGAYLGSLTAQALGTNGEIQLFGNITTDQSTLSASSGNISLQAGSGVVQHASSVTLRTSASSFSSGAGSVLINSTTTGSLSANAVGDVLTIDTSPANTASGAFAGGVSLPLLGNAGGSYLRGLSINATTFIGTNEGVVKLNGDVLLDRGSPLTGAEASLSIAAGYLELGGSSATTRLIDTLQQSLGAGGGVSIDVLKINTTSGVKLKVDTSTPDNFGGRTGGAISIKGTISAAGASTTGSAPGAVLLDSSGVATLDNGLIHLYDNVLVANGGTIGLKGATLLHNSLTLGSASGSGDVNMTLSRFLDSVAVTNDLWLAGGSGGLIDLSGLKIGYGNLNGIASAAWPRAVSITGGVLSLGSIRASGSLSASGSTVTLGGDLISFGGPISVQSSSGPLTLADNVAITSFGDNAASGGNISLGSAGSVLIGQGVFIYSQGGGGTDSAISGATATAGGAGGTVRISAGDSLTLASGANSSIFSRGGNGGLGTSTSGDGSSGGRGGDGGSVGLVSGSGSGLSSLGSNVTIASYGGQGGSGSNGAIGANASVTPIDGLPGGKGGNGGSGGYGGSIGLSGSTLAIGGSILSTGGTGGNGGNGGTGGAGASGGPGTLSSNGGNGGSGGDGGYAGNGGNISLTSSGTGLLTITGATISSSGSNAGLGGLAGAGGAQGFGGGGNGFAGTPGNPGYGPYNGSGNSVSIGSLGGMSVSTSSINGRYMNLTATNNLSLADSLVESLDGAYVFSSNGSILMSGTAKIKNNATSFLSPTTLDAKVGVQLTQLWGPKTQVYAPTIYSAAGFDNIASPNIVGDIATLGTTATPADVGTMTRPVSVSLANGSSDLVVVGNQSVWISSPGDLFLGQVQVSATSAGTISVVSGGVLTASGTVSSASAQISLTGKRVEIAGTVTSTTGQINLTSTGAGVAFDKGLEIATGASVYSGRTSAEPAIVLVGDSLTIFGSVTAGGGTSPTVAILSTTTGRDIDFINRISGTNANPSNLSLYVEDLNKISAGILQVGDINKTAGNITVVDAASLSSIGALALYANGSIAQSSLLNTYALLAKTNSSVNLTHAGNVIASVAGRAASGFTLGTSGSLSVVTLDGVAGVATDNNAGISLAAASFMDVNAKVTAGTLSNSGNTVTLKSGSRVSINNALVSGRMDGGNGVVIVADDLNLSGTGVINAGGSGIAMNPFTAGRSFLAGSSGGLAFGMTSTELGALQNYDVLRLGLSTLGNQFGAVTVATTWTVGSALELQASGDISLQGSISAATATLDSSSGNIYGPASPTAAALDVTGHLELSGKGIGSLARGLWFSADTVTAGYAAGGNTINLYSVNAINTSKVQYYSGVLDDTSFGSAGAISVDTGLDNFTRLGRTVSLYSGTGIRFNQAGGNLITRSVELYGPVQSSTGVEFQQAVRQPVGDWQITGGTTKFSNSSTLSSGLTVSGGTLEVNAYTRVGSLSNAAAGTVRLSGGDLYVDGSITSQAGLLDLGGHQLTSGVGDINNTGIISGSGIIFMSNATLGGTLLNNGTLSPGGDNTIGTINIAYGNLLLNAGGRVNMDWGSGQQDHISVSGNLTTGGLLVMTELGYFLSRGDQFNAIDYGGTVSGTSLSIGSYGSLGFGSTTTSPSNGALYISADRIPNFWTKDTNLSEQWSLGTNWSRTHAPTSGEDAFVSVANNPTITVSAGSNAYVVDLSEHLVIVGGGSLGVGAGGLVSNSATIDLKGGVLGGVGNFAILGGSTINWSGGSLQGSGTANIYAGTTLNVLAGSGQTLARSMINDGSMDVASSLALSSATLTNSGAMTVHGSGVMFSGTGLLSNVAGGTIGIASGSSTYAQVAVPLDNAGVINLSASNLILPAGVSSGQINIASGRTLKLAGNFNSSGTISNAGGTLLLEPFISTLSVGGTYNETSAGTVSASGNGSIVIDANVSTATLLQNGGDITGTGGITATRFDFSNSGSIGGSGTLITNGQASSSGSFFLGRNWNIKGGLNVTGGYLNIGTAATVTNSSGSLMDISTSYFGVLSTIQGAGRLNNVGTLRNSFRSAGSTELLYIDVADLNNTGSIVFGADGANPVRDLYIGSALTAASGSSMTVPAGKKVTLSNNDSFASGAVLNNAGTVAIAGGTTNFLGTWNNTGTLAVNGVINFNTGAEVILPTLLLAGNIGGGDAMTVTTAATLGGNILGGTGVFKIAAGATATTSAGFSLDSRTLRNEGSLQMSGSGIVMLVGPSVLENTGTITQGGSATVQDFFGDAVATVSNLSGGLYVYNASEVNGIEPLFRNNAGATLQIQSGQAVFAGGLAQAGTLNVLGGATLSSAAQTLVNAASGFIMGAGTIDTSGANLTNNGTVAPGTAGAIGTLTIKGAFQQNAGGTLAIRVNGTTTNDSLNITGGSTIGGTLAIANFSGYTMGGGETHSVLAAALGTSGTFTVISGPAGVTLIPAYNAFSVVISTTPVNNWIGTDGDWSTPGNWSLNRAPITGDIVNVNPAGIHTITLTTAAAGSLNSLNFSAGNDDIFLFSGAGASLSLPTMATLGGTVNLAGGTLTNANVGQGINKLVMSSGTINNTGSLNVAAMSLSGGQIAGAGTLSVAGAFSWDNGLISGGKLFTSGATTLASGTHGLANALWINTGTVNHSGGNFSFTNSTLSNQGVFTDTATGGALGSVVSGTNIVNNNGGTFNFNQSGVRNSGGLDAFNNDGTVNVAGGAVLNIQAGGADSGLWNVLGGGTLQFASGLRNLTSPVDSVQGTGRLNVSGGTVTVSAPFLTIAGTGTVSMTGGTLALGTGSAVGFTNQVTLTGGSALLANNGASFTNLSLAAGSTLGGSGNKLVTGTLSLNNSSLSGGTLTTQSASSVSGTLSSLSSLLWNNQGTLTVSAAEVAMAGTTLANAAAATLNVQGAAGAGFTASTASAITNNGTLNWSLSSGSRPITSLVNFSNNASIFLAGGTMDVASGSFTQAGTLDIASGTVFKRTGGFANSGRIQGTGSIAATGGNLSNTGLILLDGSINLGTGTLVNAGGSIRPGDNAIGTLAVTGNVSFSGGTVNLDLASPSSYDRITVSNSIVTGGTLNVSESTPFIAGGDSFAVMTFGGASGGAGYTINQSIPDVTLALGGSAGITSLVANSVTNRWKDNITGDWATAINWSRGHAPNSLEDVIVNPLGVQTVTLSGGVQAARSLLMVGDDTLLVTGGSLGLGLASSLASGTSLLLQGGSVGGAGALAVNGNFNWSGGTLASGGSLSTAGQVTLSGAGAQVLGRNWSNTGTIAFNGGDLQLTGNLVNQSGGIFNVNITNGTSDGFSGNGTLTNQAGATFNVTAAATASDVTMLSYFVNNGAVNIQNSLLDLHRGATQTGSFSIGTGKALRVRDADTHVFGSTSSISGAGYFEIFNTPTVTVQGIFNPADVRVSGGTLNLSGTGPYALTLLNINGGTLGGSANASVSSAFGWANGGNVAGSGTLSANGAVTIDNTVTLSGKTLRNAAAMDIGTGDMLLLTGGAVLNNLGSGTLAVANTGAHGISFTSGGGSIVNAGLLKLNNSTIATGGGNVTNSGTFDAGGSLNMGSGTLVSSGLLRPGGAGSVGTLAVTGNLDLTGGTTQFDLSSTSLYDKITVTGNVVKSGIIALNETAPFIGGGDSFNLITGGTGSGTPTLSAGITDVTMTLGGAGGTLQAGASAVTNRWKDNLSGAWEDASKWTRGHAPNALESVVINPLGTQTIQLNTGTQAGLSLQMLGDDALSINGGTLNLSQTSTVGSAASLSLLSGNLNGAAGLNIASAFNWAGGTIGGLGTLGTSGAVTMSGGGTKNLDGKAWNITAGTVNWTGGNVNLVGAGASVNAGAGATFNVATSDSTSSDMRGLGTFNTAAGSTLNMNSPLGSSSIYPSRVNLAGTTNLLQGDLDFDRDTGGTTINVSGIVNMANGSRIKGYSTIGGPVVTLNFNSGSAINVTSGTAALELNNWDLFFNTPMTLPAALNVNHSGNTVTAGAALTVAGTYALAGGTLTGAGNIALNGAFNGSGGSVAGGGTLTTAGASTLGNTITLVGKTWNNSGTISIGGGATLLLKSGAQLTNLAAGTLSVGNVGGQGIGAGTGGGSVSNAGLLDLINSTIATGGGNVTNTGLLKGSGTLDLAGTGTLVSSGTLRIGGTGAVGTLNVVGNANLTGGTMEIDLASLASYDKLVVTGGLTQGGTLSVAESTPFIAGNDSFDVVTFGSLAGGTLPVLNGSVADVGFTLGAQPNSLRLTASAVTNNWTALAGDWATAVNWSRNHAPNAFEDAVINPAGVQTITVSSGSQQARTMQLPGDDKLSITGGQLNLANASTVASTASLLLSGGVLSGGPLDVAGAFGWNGGSITGGVNVAGVLTIGNAAIKELRGTLSHSNTSGLSSWIGGNNSTGGVIDILAGGDFINQAGAVLNIATGGQNNRVGTYGSSPVGFFDNQGTLNVTGGGTFAISQSNFGNNQHQLRNFATGVVNVANSNLLMYNDASLPIAQLGTWNFTGSSGMAIMTLYGTHKWDATANITNSGNTILNVYGSTQLYSATPQTWATVFVPAGGALSLNRDFSVSNSLGWTGTISGTGATNVTLGSGATTTIIAGAASLDSANLVNNGTLNIGSGTTLTAGQQVTSAGTIALDGGKLSGANIANTGLLTGSGQLATGGTFTNTGTVAPGGTGTIGLIALTGNANLAGGVLQAELDSITSYDQFTVSGNLVQGGTIALSEKLTPFVGAGDSFNVVTYGGTLTGSASTLSSGISGVMFALNAGAGALQVQANTVINSWKDGLSGDWSNSANWTRGHAPGSLEDALIAPSGLQTITLSAGSQSPRSLQLTGDDVLAISGGTLSLANASTVGSAASVQMSGGTLAGAGNLNIAGGFFFSGGTLGGTGTLGTTGASTIASGANPRTIGRDWTNAGTLTWDSGSVSLNSRLLNVAGGQVKINIYDGNDDLSGTGTLANASGATVRVSSSAFDTTILATLINDGNVFIDAGKLDLHKGATHTGVFSIASAAELRTRGNETHTFAPGSAITGAGTYRQTIDSPTVYLKGGFTPANVELGTGTLAFTAGGTQSVNTLAVNGGTLSLGGTLSAGTVSMMPSGAAVVTVNGSGLIDTRRLTINASGLSTGYVTIGSGAGITTVDGAVAGVAGRSSGFDLVIDGRLAQGNGIVGLNYLTLTNATIGGIGTLAAGAGNLDFVGTTSVGSVLQASAASQIDFAVGGTYTLSGTSSKLDGLVYAGSGSTINLASAGLTQAAGGYFYSDATVNVTKGATFGGGVVINSGSLNLSGPAVSVSGAGASLSIASGGTLSGPGQLVVAGGRLVSIGGAVGIGLLDVNAGSVSVSGANLTVGKFTQTGGQLSGNGDFSVTNAFSQTAGTLVPGFSNISITQQTGNLAVGSLQATNSVTLAATSGSLTDSNGAATNVTAASVKLLAFNGIDLDLNTPVLDATLTSIGNVDISNIGALQLAALSAAAGSASIATTGTLTQSGAIKVLGATTLSTGGAGVTLTNAVNDFGGTVSLVGAGATQIRDTGSLAITGSATSLSLDGGNVQMSALGVSGPLTIVATGQIGQGSAINVTGLSSLSAASILLPTSSTYSGGITFNSAGDVTLNSGGAMVLGGTANYAGGKLSLTALGPVSQNAALTISGSANVSAAGQSVNFDTQLNDFSSVSFNAASAQVRDINSLVIGGNVSGTVVAHAGSGVSGSGFSFGGLIVGLSGTGAISFVQTDVSGAANFGTTGAGSYSAISYENISTTGTLGGSMLATGLVDLAFKNKGLALPQIQAGTLSVSAGGAITQTGALNASVTSMSGQSLVLNNPSNHLGALTLKTGNASITDAGTLKLAGLASGALNVQSGAVSQAATDALVTGSATISGAGGTALIGMNQLGTLVAASGGAITVNDVGATLALGNITTPGLLAVQSGGAVLQMPGSTLTSGSLDMIALSIGTPLQPLEFVSPTVQFYSASGDIYAHSSKGFNLVGLGAAAGKASPVASAPVFNLTALAPTGNASLVSAGAMTVSGPVDAATNLSLKATNLVVQAKVSGADVTLDAGTQTLAIGGGATAASVAGANLVTLIGHDITLLGGTGKGAKAEVLSDGKVSVNAAGNFVIQGGFGTGASAQISSVGPVTITTGGAMNLTGGTGSGAYARVEAGLLSLVSVTAQSVNLLGGVGPGAYAALTSEGNVTVAANNITMAAGTGLDADAVVISYFGKVTLPTCNGCLTLTTPPLGNGVTDAGVLGGDDYRILIEESTVGSNELIRVQDFLDKFTEPLVRRKRKDEIVIDDGAVSCTPP